MRRRRSARGFCPHNNRIAKFLDFDCVSRSSSLEIATIATLQIINNAATIDVNFVKKVPTVLADVKLSCETPNPKAPPSDLCNKIIITKIIAKTIFTKISKLSMMLIYSNSLLYQ